MNRSPVNSVAVAGNITYRPEMIAALQLQSDFAITYGLGLAGNAEAVLQSDGYLSRITQAGGTAQLQLQSDCDSAVTPATFSDGVAELQLQAETPLSIRVRPSSTAEMLVSASGTPYLIVNPAMGGDMDIQSELESYIVASKPGKAVFELNLDSELDPTINRPPRGSGVMSMSLRSNMDLRVAKSHSVAGVMEARLDGSGAASLKMYPDAVGEMSLDAMGSFRFGGRIPLKGRATMVMSVSLDSLKWRHVYIGGAAEMHLQLVANRHGRPVIPEEYSEAHYSNQFRVYPDRNEFTVEKWQ